ncbi:hypothetical protein K469DRAFT_608763 [Zopfia rhizophila CBS 207.26]|uniref:Peptidase M43 pregnancy-associated plasma-A domain-containing protein n=1 Tax=Zopfia rhizophila CBS 207.26 TaxID=1314779 RepID=A0A6A6DAB1_9PEZI|nr:hypothetical protein K469DRAFT_608763 [Zopfia rhizophila CBS 207.26]
MLEEVKAHLTKRDTIVIDLWVHFLVSSWNIPLDAPGLMNQFWYLNEQYAPFGISFQLKPVSYAMNADWAADIDNSKAEKMKQLHRGDYKSLNVYLVEGAGGGVCSLPLGGNMPVTQEQLDGDGCFIPLSSGVHAPDGTLTHEIGHWFGLLHVFEGGCGGSDYCNDTSPQAGPSYSHKSNPDDIRSCPAVDSCPQYAGTDNIFNFMDYTDCSSEFTNDQRARALAIFQSYRANRAIADGVRWK